MAPESLASSDSDYQLVRLANGTCSIHSIAEGETFHPVVGPAAEAQALYVNQLKLRERVRAQAGEFVIWDVGLGAAANVLTALRATSDLPCSLHVISFDRTIAPLQFALRHAAELGYLAHYESAVQSLLETGRADFKHEQQSVTWRLCMGDFPQFLRRPGPAPAPHAIMFDAFSPAKNPEMWTAPLFSDLFRALDPGRPCAMPTYSRSTMLRVTLLLAGFYVGIGHATGEKEETTIAANTLDLIDEPLPAAWLRRARLSKSAEPLWEPVYRQARISPETWEKLRRHPQFA
ncbi:MAG: MnmC family methyltransferase [Verrucomicrobiota bacterium]|jgi:tRNA U34 5-methylaminomethyl-2-thiouridine-forming methyltransferase MnmC